MQAIRLITAAMMILTATTVSAQFAGRGMNRGGRGGGLHGVTRRTFMGAPNAMAARYYQNAGLPLVDPQRVDAVESGGDAFLAANQPAGTPPVPGQTVQRSATFAAQPGGPVVAPAPRPAWPATQGFARAVPQPGVPPADLASRGDAEIAETAPTRAETLRTRR